ncbi:30S ribosome-binding factor RbfA [Azospirillum brasilense]|uniref:Ribosome-binding factor A n=1 Tax=Azospirillum brasilense TaxID=192 RepID=A0A6L3AZI9_AZOBR|nr:30S ribosome-binding factor RbfA [Azospirillum brasilense]KAA0685085.1 30S ribosome-binding factor RbfA [Azospirillum brasilense]
MRKKHDLAGKPPSQRQLRIGEEIRHALADLFRRGDFHDPELAELNVTVTEVRISPDLRNATAFVTPLGGGPMDETLSALRRAAPFLRGQVARAINLRHAPTLSFEADTSFDYAGRIDDILHSPAVARDVGYRSLADRVNGDDDHDEEDDGWDEEDETETDDLDDGEDIDDEDEDEDEDDGDEGNGGEGEGRRGS